MHWLSEGEEEGKGMGAGRENRVCARTGKQKAMADMQFMSQSHARDLCPLTAICVSAPARTS